MSFEKVKEWVGIGRPGGWDDVVIRTVKTGVAAFVMLALKAGLDDFDTEAAAAALDAAYVAGGTFLLNAVLKWTNGEEV